MIKKTDYVNKINGLFEENDNSKKIMLNQINNYFDCPSDLIIKHSYNVGDDVYLTQGTLLHGTYKNFDGLNSISKNGLISGDFISGRLSKYRFTVGVWNLKKDYYLKDYINFYSGGTIEYKNKDGIIISTEVIPYNKLNELQKYILDSKCFSWFIQQTKEARFLPSIVQNEVQIGIIFDGNNKYVQKLIENDILNTKISDNYVKKFINPDYYETFIRDRVNKNDFFTDRESAILFGIPSVFIEGILVGRIYEKDNEILDEIKKLLPNAYICNLDGKVIRK